MSAVKDVFTCAPPEVSSRKCLKCFKCQKTALQAVIKCIQCEAIYHRSCASVLNKKNSTLRILSNSKLICLHHQDIFQPSTSQNSSVTMPTTAPNKDDMLPEGLQEKSFVDLINQAINAAILPLLSEISQLKQEVRDLRQSNIDLIRCVSNAPFTNFGVNKRVQDQVQQHCPADFTNSNIKTKDQISGPLVSDDSSAGKVSKLYNASTNKSSSSSLLNNLPKVEDANNNDSKSLLNKDEIDNDGFTTVARKSRVNRYIRGKNVDSTNAKIKAVNKPFVGYVGNLLPGTSVEEVNSFLALTFPLEYFTTEMLPKRDNAKSVSFKITMDHSISDQFLKAETWPVGILIKKFYFLKEKTATALPVII